MSLKFIALSGTISVTENLYVYEQGNDMMVLDCGVGFPDLEMRGVDLVIPDFSYIVKNKHKLRGVLLSQGHEDHIGALPFLLREVQTEIWAAPLVTELLKDKFGEYKLSKVKINTFNPNTDEFDIGPFKINPFRVTHSVPDSCGFAIDTSEGRIFHVPEHKMDQDPVDGMPFDIQKAKRLANEKQSNLFLASDCLGANKPGMGKGEKHIEDNLLEISKTAKQALFFTAISSNIGRFQQAINVATKLGRKVVFVGRSVQKKCEIAHNLGYLKYSRDQVVDPRRAGKLPANKLMYIIAGCYGQNGSSLYRLALGEHKRIQIEKGDTLIFSADPAPPYTKESEDFVVDNLIDRGVDVHYYDLKEDIYVSGHGRQEDIVELFSIVRPKYFIPIGGAVRFMHAYEKLAVNFGAPKQNVFKLKPGDGIEFSNGNAKRLKNIPVKEVLVDGLGIGDVGRVVLKDRKDLSEHGVVVAVVKLNDQRKLVEDPQIVSRGFVFERMEKEFLKDSSKSLGGQLRKLDKLDNKSIKNTTVNYLADYFYSHTARRPMILPVVVDL